MSREEHLSARQYPAADAGTYEGTLPRYATHIGSTESAVSRFVSGTTDEIRTELWPRCKKEALHKFGQALTEFEHKPDKEGGGRGDGQPAREAAAVVLMRREMATDGD